ncbi:cobaltochelatase subunit CobT [Stenotrophomonas sp. VV52]|uniref:cobaltochelatase CobT-related protein n=1 Tax=Stenotrophomonas sp. VV52 TaxID=2066958 RepID=UPI000C9DB491|nr:cobaltochelatase subunit CobT [Stenotrophomonas sp. VV52]
MKAQRGAEQDAVRLALDACSRALAGDRNAEQTAPRSSLALSRLAVTRGISDARALRRAHHDARMHEDMAPNNPHARAVYDALESVRIEAVGAVRMRGVARNLAAALENALDEREADATTVLALILRTRLTSEPSPVTGAAALAKHGAWVHDQFENMLQELPYVMYEQSSFARVVTRHLDALAADVLLEAHMHRAPLNYASIKGADEPGQTDAVREKQHEHFEDATELDQPAIVDVPSTLDRRDGQPLNPARLRAASRTIAADTGYRVFTTEFDQIANARDLRTPEELQRLRGVLNRHRAAHRVTVGRLAARLQRHLMARQQRDWAFDLEEGELDTARLARIIIDPTQPLSFKQERESRFRDTAVTLLIDNSGSMHGRPIAVAAVCCDILAATLERCGVSVEILGFTTGAWNGGQPRERWLKAARPAAPGRLNQTRHIIYKSAQQPLRRARSSLGLMLCDELLKENIDGEALLWAHQRLLARPEQRRLLIVVSDGAPADDATLSANPRDYLERHLRAVIDMIEKRSPVELVAIGMGHDVGRHYASAVTIREPEQLAGALTNELGGLLVQRAARRHHCAGAGATSSRSTR